MERKFYYPETALCFIKKDKKKVFAMQALSFLQKYSEQNNLANNPILFLSKSALFIVINLFKRAEGAKRAKRLLWRICILLFKGIIPVLFLFALFHTTPFSHFTLFSLIYSIGRIIDSIKAISSSVRPYFA